MQHKLIFMIISQQFGYAPKTKADYKCQLENGMVQSAPKVGIFDIKKKTSKHIFFKLQR